VPEPSAEAQAAAELVRLAKEQGLSLTGPDGLLKQLTKTVLETALAEEMTEHLGYEKHDPACGGERGRLQCVGFVDLSHLDGRNGSRGGAEAARHGDHVDVVDEAVDHGCGDDVVAEDFRPSGGRACLR
jgi:hypothetical protein